MFVECLTDFCSYFSCSFLPWFSLRPPAPSLRGQVLDPSGAAVPGLTVTVVGPTGMKLAVQTDDQGKYAFRNLAPGAYTLTIRLKGFNDFVKAGIVIARGQPQVVNAQLSVAVEKQQITVTDDDHQGHRQPRGKRQCAGDQRQGLGIALRRPR